MTDEHAFTPGPWAAHEDSDGNFTIIAPNILGRGREIAEVEGDYPDPTIGNACLIAAAPALLKACELARELLSYNSSANAREVVAVMTSAIHRARSGE